MRVNHIKIHNHAKVPDLDVAVRDHLVVVGANDSGKTSLLRSLDALFRSTMSELYRWSADTLRDPSRPLTIEAELIDFDDDDRATLADEIELVPGEHGRFNERLVLRLSVEAPPDDQEARVVQRRFVKDGFSCAVRADHLRAIAWSFLRAARSADVELGGRSGAVRALLREVELGSDADALLLASQAFGKAVKDAESLEGLRGRVAKALDDLYPYSIEASDIEVALPNSSESDLLADVDLHLTRDGRRTSLSGQSDGLRALSTVAMHRLAKRSARIIGIDEPELHLHPRSQALLGSLLRADGGQVILATHSPQILSAFRPSDILVLTGLGASQCIDRSLDEDWRFLQHQWLDATLEPLTSRAVILVEGVSDRILVHAVARALGRPLDQAGISLIAVHGATAFKPVHRLLGARGFNLTIFTLVDAEESPIAASAIGCDESELADHRVSVCHADLEEECVTALGIERHVALLDASGLITERAIRGALRVTSVSNIDIETYVRWCRNDKVRVAAALADQLTDSDASAIATLADLVRSLP